jgi:tyrosyl-tRNA synthetase
MTCPVLAGLDGTRRMSKSLGNYIGVTEEPEQMYGKVMSIPDALLESWTKLVSRWEGAELDEALERVASGRDPMGAKAELASRIVSLYHGDDAAVRAAAHFDRVVRRKDVPEEIETRTLSLDAARQPMSRLLKELGLVPSTSEARRLVEAGAVTIDGQRFSSPQAGMDARSGDQFLLRVGKRSYLRLLVQDSGRAVG